MRDHGTFGEDCGRDFYSLPEPGYDISTSLLLAAFRPAEILGGDGYMMAEVAVVWSSADPQSA